MVAPDLIPVWVGVALLAWFAVAFSLAALWCFAALIAEVLNDE